VGSIIATATLNLLDQPVTYTITGSGLPSLQSYSVLTNGVLSTIVTTDVNGSFSITGITVPAALQVVTPVIYAFQLNDPPVSVSATDQLGTILLEVK
jgi:hypothetical protein